MGKVPGLQRTMVSRFTRAIMGDVFYMMAEMSFADESTLKQAMRSPEMAAAGDNLASFARDLVTLMFAEDPVEVDQRRGEVFK
jgi:uncharacterized protein (TIGR02118 family)